MLNRLPAVLNWTHPRTAHRVGNDPFVGVAQVARRNGAEDLVAEIVSQTWWRQIDVPCELINVRIAAREPLARRCLDVLQVVEPQAPRDEGEAISVSRLHGTSRGRRSRGYRVRVVAGLRNRFGEATESSEEVRPHFRLLLRRRTDTGALASTSWDSLSEAQ